MHQAVEIIVEWTRMMMITKITMMMMMSMAEILMREQMQYEKEMMMDPLQFFHNKSYSFN